MAELFTVQATIISIGDTTQIQYLDKATGEPKEFSKFTFEYMAAGNESEVFDGEGPQWHKGKLEVGGVYELVLKYNANPSGGYYTPSIEKISSDPNAVAQKAPGKPKPPENNPPVSTKDSTPGRKPDLNGRWREYSSHARTAQMQASERVGLKVKLLLSDRLVTEDDKPIGKIKESTLATWYIEEYDRYWLEIEQ